MLRRLAVASTLAVALSACGLGGTDRLGLSGDGRGGVLIHYVVCPGEVVTRVAVLGNTQGIGYSTGSDVPGGDPDDDEFVMWQAGNPQGTTESVFPVGGAPRGFTEEIPLTMPLEEEGELTAFIGSRSDDLHGVEVGFELDEVKPGQVISNLQKEPLGQAEFERMARATCK